jgi:hypothetical protein
MPDRWLHAPGVPRPPPPHQVQRLKESGVIRIISAPARPGRGRLPAAVYVTPTLARHDPRSSHVFDDQIRVLPQIIAADKVADDRLPAPPGPRPSAQRRPRRRLPPLAPRVHPLPSGAEGASDRCVALCGFPALQHNLCPGHGQLKCIYSGNSNERLGQLCSSRNHVAQASA